MSKVCKFRQVVLIIFIFCVLLILFQLNTFKRFTTNSKQNEVIGNDESRTFQVQRLLARTEASTKNGSQCETIHISIVCAGIDSSREVVTLIKSLLFYRKNPLHVHFVVNDMSRLILSHLFRTWDIPDFTISFYLVDDFIEKILWIPNKHYSGVYGLLKIVMMDILSDHITRVISLDTDLVFATDIAELWKLFDDFEDQEAIGLVENQSDWYLGTLWRKYTPWPALGRGFNTGVMLLDCEKLRLWKWGAKWEKITREVLVKIPNTALADQDIINSVLKEHPFLVHRLPCFWNLQLSDNMKLDFCYSQHHHEVRVLHWNTRNKNKSQYAHIKAIQYLYQNFVELNGELVRLPSTNCKNVEDYQDYLESSDEDDPCHEFTVSSSSLHRTHLYFLPFEYTSDRKNDVSIIVQLSVDRFPMLEKLCKYWDGPVSAAIFVTDTDAQRLINFVKVSPFLNSRRNIAYHFVYQNANEEIYPINFLRNVALHYSVTDYVFLYDVDFVPMPGLYQYIATHLTSAETISKTAFVIPAFENLWYKFEMPTTKSELLKQLDNGAITTFRSYMWPKGHAATNFIAWKEAKQPYDVQWEPHFEPYVVVNKQNCPAYDKRFTGFGWNKISHIMELDAAGFSFTVLPFGFIIHLPHSPSIDLLKYRTLSTYRDCLDSAKFSFMEYLTNKYGSNSSKYTELYV